MDPFFALIIVVALVALTAIFGAVMQRRGAKVRRIAAEQTHHIDLKSLGITDALSANTGAPNTGTGHWHVIQFTTQWCAQCPGVVRSIERAIGDRTDIAFAQVDLTERGDLAAQHKILQTPTVFVVSPRGELTARISGPVKGTQVVALVDESAASTIAVTSAVPSRSDASTTAVSTATTPTSSVSDRIIRT